MNKRLLVPMGLGLLLLAALASAATQDARSRSQPLDEKTTVGCDVVKVKATAV